MEPMDLSKFQVAFDGETVAVTGRIYTREAAERLIAILNAQQSLLPPYLPGSGTGVNVTHDYTHNCC